jgi:MYXO-CTERM domain-containing protein
MWRVVNDFWDFNALTDLPGVFRAANTWQAVNGIAQGHWPDLDMLPLGYLGPRNEWHASGQTTFTRNEQVTIMSLWSILPSPLMYGGNPARLASDEWTRALLTNEEVLAVNQDPLGARGRRTAVTGGELWVRDLSDGRKAVALFNRGTQDATMSATFAQIGITGTPVVRDLWRRADVTAMTSGISASVPGGAAVLYRLTVGGGAGGTGGASGGGAAGAASGGGGTSSGGAGGAATAAGGIAGATTGGGAATGGAAGSAGTAGAGPANGGATNGGTTNGGTTNGGATNGGAAGVATGNGGSLGGGASGAASGGAAFGGASGASARGGVTTAGRGMPAGGSLGTAGAQSGGGTGDSSGCGCSLPGAPRSAAPFGLFVAVAGALARRRRPASAKA